MHTNATESPVSPPLLLQPPRVGVDVRAGHHENPGHRSDCRLGERFNITRVGTFPQPVLRVLNVYSLPSKSEFSGLGRENNTNSYSKNTRNERHGEVELFRLTFYGLNRFNESAKDSLDHFQRHLLVQLICSWWARFFSLASGYADWRLKFT